MIQGKNLLTNGGMTYCAVDWWRRGLPAGAGLKPCGGPAEYHRLGTLRFIYCINRRDGGQLSRITRDEHAVNDALERKPVAASELVAMPGARGLGIFQPSGDILLQVRCTWFYGNRSGETPAHVFRT